MSSKDGARKSFESMVDHMMKDMFLSREASIKGDVMTAEEADEIIKERSNFYIEKYEAMNLKELEFLMIEKLIGSALKEIREEMK